MATSEKKPDAAAGRERDPSAAQRLLAHYRTMALLRAANSAAGALSLAGEAGLVIPAAGTEALVAGLAAAMDANDWVLASPRHAGIALARGASLESWLAQVLGRCTDPTRGRQEPGHVAFRGLGVVSIGTAPGARLPHAMGVARAMKAARRGEVAIATCGEAATATPDFHVALNFAALWEVPVVFVVASGEPLACPLGAPVSAKGAAYGMTAQSCDGRDALEVESAASAAIERARSGGGPTLLEVACPASPKLHPRSGPRPVGETRSWSDDPLAWAREQLLERGRATEDELAAVLREARERVESAVAVVRALPPPPKGTLFDGVFARRTPALERQRREWMAQRQERD